jgi:hypothetical protein
MSLNWNISNIKNYEEICFSVDDDGEKYLSGITEALIFHTMAIGMGEITEQNVSEFYNRASLYAKFFGNPIRYYDEQTEKYETRRFTANEIKNHIGLSTNVSYESPTKWRNRIWKYEIERFNYERALENGR